MICHYAGSYIKSSSFTCERFGRVLIRHTSVMSRPLVSHCPSPYSSQRFSPVTICKSFLWTSGSRVSRKSLLKFGVHEQKRASYPLAVSSMSSSTISQQTYQGLSSWRRSMSLRLPILKHRVPKINWITRPNSWMLGGGTAGLFVCFSSSEPVYAESGSSVNPSHGKVVYKDYSVTGIPGDGRCLFRSVAHGACIRAGKSTPNEKLQRELADELREQVANEFVKRRPETEWFIEGDFDIYVSQIRRPHVWGGEPELLMASHVLQMPITVYMHDEEAGGLITIAEYGQEYGNDDPIRVLYHGFGHYDALQIPGKKGARSRL